MLHLHDIGFKEVSSSSMTFKAIQGHILVLYRTSIEIALCAYTRKNWIDLYQTKTKMILDPFYTWVKLVCSGNA